MPTKGLRPILNSSLPPQFRRVRIELAREAGHPDGAANVGYVLVVPLDVSDRIDVGLWRENRDACRVARFRPGEPDQHGMVSHRGSGWSFHYLSSDNVPDETTFHFGDEHFVPGEYVSINENGKLHTYRVTSVAPL